MGLENRVDTSPRATSESGGSVAEPSVPTPPPATPNDRGYTPSAVSRRPLGCLIEIAETLVLTIVIFWLIQSFVAQPYKVEQESMEDTLMPQQYVLVDKLSPHFDAYSRGDIVVFNPLLREDSCNADAADASVDGTPVTPYIKRVIGEPGDDVKLVDGKVVVNGVKLNEPYVRNGVPTEPLSDQTEWHVPADRLFLMGDHRDNSTDSRSDQIGMVCIRDVIGRAWLRYWPINTLGILQTPTYPDVPSASPLPTAAPTP
jgi:signal peptidase I